MFVAEVKNLSRGPGKNEVLQVANYLNARGTGLFAPILARTDLDPAARWTSGSNGSTTASSSSGSATKTSSRW